MPEWKRNFPWVLYLLASVLSLAAAGIHYAASAGKGQLLLQVGLGLTCGSLAMSEWERAKQELPSPEVLPKALGVAVRWRPVWATLLATLVLAFVMVVFILEVFE